MNQSGYMYLASCCEAGGVSVSDFSDWRGTARGRSVEEPFGETALDRADCIAIAEDKRKDSH